MDPTQKRTIQKRTISPRSWYRYEGQSQVGEFSRGGRLRCFEPLRALDHDMEPDVLESHWSGALLTDLDAVREWTKTMRWDGIAPNVYFLNREYHRGVKLTAREMKSYSMRLLRTPLIERWSLFIQPQKTAQYFPAKALNLLHSETTVYGTVETPSYQISPDRNVPTPKFYQALEQF